MKRQRKNWYCTRNRDSRRVVVAGNEGVRSAVLVARDLSAADLRGGRPQHLGRVPLVGLALDFAVVCESDQGRFGSVRVFFQWEQHEDVSKRMRRGQINMMGRGTRDNYPWYTALSRAYTSRARCFGALTPALQDALGGRAAGAPPAHVQVLAVLGVTVGHLAALGAGGHLGGVFLTGRREERYKMSMQKLFFVCQARHTCMQSVIFVYLYVSVLPFESCTW